MKTATIAAPLMLLLSLGFALGMQSSSPTPTPAATPATEETGKQPITLRLSSGVVEGLSLHKVNPKYPVEARRKHIQGDVRLQFTIDKQGNIVDLAVVNGDPLLAQAALDAVKQWKYSPFIFNGKPVAVRSTVVVNFRL